MRAGALTMNEAQFEVLAKLLRSRDPARTAARLVLLEDKSVTEAVAETGMSQPGVSQAVRRYREAFELIESAFGRKRPHSNVCAS